ncbi:UbiA prenyltransferase family protein [Candidatus Woesearchaeota archaeon]|nr:UbiA prenyltransferase family protein [Candidatus Woesearchaeota archaeon]
MGFEDITDLIKSTRLHRTLTGLCAIMVPVSIANSITKEIFFLGLSGILIYAAAGIHNAKRDSDYALPSYYKIVIALILVLALSIAFSNKIILITILLYTILGYVYNSYSRYVLFGDVTLLSITHHTIPTVASSILLGLRSAIIVKLSVYMFVTFWFLIHLKNLKDTREDKDRGYKTLTTEFKNGREWTLFCYEIGFASIALAYFLFGFGIKYIFFLLIIYILKNHIVHTALFHREKESLNYMRFMVLFFLIGFVSEYATSAVIYLISGVIFSLYTIFLINDIKPDLLNLSYKLQHFKLITREKASRHE